MPDNEPLLTKDVDILDRNVEVNAIMSKFAETYTRRRVIDTLLAIVIALLIGVIILLAVSNDHLDNHLIQIELHETQLECAQLPNTNTYLMCQNVGKPIRIGVNK